MSPTERLRAVLATIIRFDVLQLFGIQLSDVVSIHRTTADTDARMKVVHFTTRTFTVLL